MSKLVPVVIGVGDVVNHSTKIEDAKEPLDLILQAIDKALDDTGSASKSSIQAAIDSISIVRTWTWPYPDLPGLLASKLDVNPSHKEYTDHGGNQPGRIFDEAAKRISLGQSKIAVLAGGEALASLTSFAKANKLPPPSWTKLSTNINDVFSPTDRQLPEGRTTTTSLNALIGASWAADNTRGLGRIYQIGAPIHIYPLFENGFRAYRGQSIAENNAESARLYGEFARVASGCEYAWSYGKMAETEEGIGRVTGRNRMICFPYPLLMNAFNTINLAGAVILTSTETARELGVPESKWVYPLGGAGTRDSYDFWERPDYHSSPSISRSIDAALQVSGLSKDDIDCYDFYSCFPIVPKLACNHLGLSITNPEKPITLLGGLTSFGGAGNNYSMHALTAMTRELRKGERRTGLVLANGGVATYQYAVILSRSPRESAYPIREPLPAVITDIAVPKVDATVEGEAVVETYTVEFDRTNNPLRGHVVGRLKSNGHRFLANHGNEATLQQLASFSKEPIGRGGIVKQDSEQKGRNLFSFSDEPRL
ncbi:hypothetical protein LTS08_005848 [Lithohypha guttulata]|uniref:uncharacterized protein n=1 Tax=Lithohypha guttulata TaxID=1690604 RepID=UPI002DE10604|nr:hypothetical protein LTR51_002361 [Lithohypha guttulata]KAK5099267.1 hypothetical protein LTS08_005848 [Lithohypha guttulata]